MEKRIKRIVVIGPESTGKSSLCSALALHYKTIWVKEFAREYLKKKGSAYEYADLYDIAKAQIAAEDAAAIQTAGLTDLNLPTPLFIDTDLQVIKVWSEFVFNKCDNRILTQITKRNYDLYLLCNIDLPWVKDNLREYPELKIREKLFNYYKETMVEQSNPWKIISGGYEERQELAVKYTDQILSI